MIGLVGGSLDEDALHLADCEDTKGRPCVSLPALQTQKRAQGNMSHALNTEEVAKFVDHAWDSSIIPKIEEYIRIPNQSPLFDAHWAENGYCDQAVDLLVNWVNSQDVKGMKLEVVRLEKRTPVIFIEIEASEKASSKT